MFYLNILFWTFLFEHVKYMFDFFYKLQHHDCYSRVQIIYKWLSYFERTTHVYMKNYFSVDKWLGFYFQNSTVVLCCLRPFHFYICMNDNWVNSMFSLSFFLFSKAYAKFAGAPLKVHKITNPWRSPTGEITCSAET